MQAAGKVQGSMEIKAELQSRTRSAKSTAGSGDFTAMMQVKREQAKQQEDGKVRQADKKKADKEVTGKPEETKEEETAEGKTKTAAGEDASLQQEALQQAALQQAAALLNGMAEQAGGGLQGEVSEEAVAEIVSPEISQLVPDTAGQAAQPPADPNTAGGKIPEAAEELKDVQPETVPPAKEAGQELLAELDKKAELETSIQEAVNKALDQKTQALDAAAGQRDRLSQAVEKSVQEAQDQKTLTEDAGKQAAAADRKQLQKAVSEAGQEDVQEEALAKLSRAETVQAPSRGQGTEKEFSQERFPQAGNERIRRIDGDNGENVQTMGAGESFRVAGRSVQEMFFGRKSENVSMRTSETMLPQDLGKTLAANLKDAGQTLTVELEPAALGKLTIRLIYEGDRASISIMATNPKTLDLLNEKASEIASIIEEKTGQETLIYTQETQQNQDNYDREAGGRGNQDQERREQKDQGQDEKHQADSFAQQLRLGLVGR